MVVYTLLPMFVPHTRNKMVARCWLHEGVRRLRAQRVTPFEIYDLKSPRLLADYKKYIVQNIPIG